MEKNSFETYEFLTATNSDSDSNQFYVLQEDGTILRNLNPTEESAPVFEIPAQEYYVEFQENTAQIISINDQFAITNAENNVISYNTNGYLIQPSMSHTESTLRDEQMETETFIDPQTLDARQLQQLNVEAFNGTKQATNLTEITLSDEQYHILEQKGWLLLESNDKIFVLNTLGLHDITDNDKLISRLKNELQQDANTNSDISQLKIESISNTLPTGDSDDVDTQEEGNVVEYFIANSVPGQNIEASENLQYIINDNVEETNNNSTLQPVPEPTESIATELPVTYELWSDVDNNEVHNINCEPIEIKTKYVFKDIPDKIFLGKTVNGKKLFAKVRRKSNDVDVQNEKVEKTKQISSLDPAVFTRLVQESFRDMTRASVKHVAYAQAVISQLLRLPNFNQSIVGNNLVFTKAIICESETGEDTGKPSMVTGRVQTLNGEDTFVHTPLMLQELLKEAEDKSKGPATPLSSLEEKTARGIVELLHIHISEMRYADRASETSINLTQRKLPLDVLHDAKKRHPNPAFACGTCGAVFNSEMQLKGHQDDECIEVEDELTIDTDDCSANISTLYTVTTKGTEKVYSCSICETKFARLFNCKKHIQAHKTGTEKKLKAYKCKMCPSTYFHSSSLAKHIVKTHIKMKLN